LGFGTRRSASERVDTEQLGYIAEIAKRLGKGEDVLLVVADFLGRRIKDHRGLPWGPGPAQGGQGHGERLRVVLPGGPLVSPHEARRQAAPAGTAIVGPHGYPKPRRFTIEKRRQTPQCQANPSTKKPPGRPSRRSGLPLKQAWTDGVAYSLHMEDRWTDAIA